MRIGARIFNLALVVALGCANAPLHAAEAWSPVKMKPMNAISLDEGDKHIVSYFASGGGGCELTMIIADAWGSPNDEVPDTKPSRVVAEIASGRSAEIFAAKGKSLSFLCADDALSVTVTKTDRLALDSRSR